MEGKVSWFGGPHDSTDSGHTASGGTTKEPGIAVYNKSTLGGYWRVTANNGKTAILRQTDLGPAPWTGRKIDVTYSALGHFGYNEHNFPTNSTFKAQYLGKSLPRGQKEGPVQTTPTSTTRVPGGFNQGGFNQAQEQRQALSSLLRSTGVKGIEVPNIERSKFETPGKVVREAPLGNHAAAAVVPGETKLGGLIPKSAPLSVKRVDEGQDVQLAPGQVLRASGDWEVVAVKNDPTGFGPAYPIIRFTTGPLQGKSVYFGHTDSLVKPGQKGKAGEPIAKTSKTGHNAPPGWAEIGEGQTVGQGNQGQGARIRKALGF